MAHVLQGDHTVLPATTPTHRPYRYLPLLPNKVTPPFGWYLLHFPTKGWPVDLGVWSHTEINVPRRELYQDTVTHPSPNRAQCRLTSLIDTHTLLLCHTANNVNGFSLQDSFMWSKAVSADKQ